MEFMSRATAALSALSALVTAAKRLYALYGHGRWIAAIKGEKQPEKHAVKSKTAPKGIPGAKR